jgi:putative protease
MVERSSVGTVTHYYGNIGVAVVQLKGELKLGDSVEIEGASTKLSQKVASMQIDHKEVSACKAGDDVGLKVDGKVHEGDTVYKVS